MVCHISFRYTYRKHSGDLSKMFQVSPGEQPKQFHKLLFMKWVVKLRWDEKEENITGRYENFLRLMLSVELVPDPDFKEKLGDVWIVPGNITLHVNDNPTRMRIKSVPLKEPLVLKKGNSYQATLSSYESPIRVPQEELNNWHQIAVDVEIILVKHTLNIIEPVSIPPCPVS